MTLLVSIFTLYYVFEYKTERWIIVEPDDFNTFTLHQLLYNKLNKLNKLQPI